ncbi:MAG: hypothetical protein C0518_03605 [Opitutus sp.]|nr:hypothetical protein [Opitutus sp.]
MTRCRSFSLIEVVIAIGVVAMGVTVVLGLMAAAVKMVGEASDRHGAERALASGVAELERLGFSAATARLTAATAEPAEENRFFESHDGNRSGWGGAVAASARFYAVTVHRVENVSPSAGDATGRGVAVLLRVEWPAGAAERSAIQLTHVLLR